jgi:hypothetical protein
MARLIPNSDMITWKGDTKYLPTQERRVKEAGPLLGGLPFQQQLQLPKLPSPLLKVLALVPNHSASAAANMPSFHLWHQNNVNE